MPGNKNSKGLLYIEMEAASPFSVQKENELDSRKIKTQNIQLHCPMVKKHNAKAMKF